VASTYDGKPVTADDLRAGGAMTVIMKEAIKPNIVQTMEGQPALVHAGPFGNIAHAANSILADRIALKLADYVITEAGFASDLGFQKFCDIVCRTARITPSAAVLVTTVRATKSHGGVAFNDLGGEDLEAIRRGADNIAAHVQIVRQYGLPCVVTVNGFPTDSPREIALVRELALNAGAETVVVHEGFAKGGAGAEDLAKAVVDACEQPNKFAPLTPDGTPIVQQIEAIATRIYGATGIDLQMQAQKDLERVEKLGFGTAPVCMAKTQMSLSHDPALRNRPTGFILPVRSLLPSAGAGFVVALCGDMQRMPGLGKTPAFMKMDIDEQGRTMGLT
jgi:formyltetrahydrofolate synthetase